MKIFYGKLMFQDGDKLNIEDNFGKVRLIAKSGFECEKCEFYILCNSNKNNVMRNYCMETHFITEADYLADKIIN